MRGSNEPQTSTDVSRLAGSHPSCPSPETAERLLCAGHGAEAFLRREQLGAREVSLASVAGATHWFHSV